MRGLGIAVWNLGLKDWRVEFRVSGLGIKV